MSQAQQGQDLIMRRGLMAMNQGQMEPGLSLANLVQSCSAADAQCE